MAENPSLTCLAMRKWLEPHLAVVHPQSVVNWVCAPDRNDSVLGSQGDEAEAEC